MPSECHITGTLYKVGQLEATPAIAANTRIRVTPVGLSGVALSALSFNVTSDENGLVDFYAAQGANITIAGSVVGFTGSGATVTVPSSSSATFESLVAITVTPATFGNPMTTAGDLIVGGVSGAAQRLAKGSNGQVLTVTAGVLGWADAGFGSGSVTSVGLSLPNIFTVSNSPVTTTGTLTGTLANQNANLVFAGPGTGSAAAPSFRSLVAGDIPDLSATYQPLSTNLTTYAGIAPSANVQTLLGAASFAAFRTSLGVAIGSNVQAWDADLDAIAALAGTSGLLQKTGANTWSLDTSTYATQAYANALVVGLLDDRGNYDASGNAFPSSGGSGSAGAILKGDLWTVSVAGTLGGTAVTAGDVVRALADSPGQTASNWAIGENNFGYVALNQALADGKIYVGNASGIGTAVTPSGDVTITNAGVFAIGSAKVTNAMLAGSIAYSKLSLTGAVLNADLAGSIAYSKLSLTGAILNADLAGSIAASKLVGTDIATVGTVTSGTLSTGAVIGGVTMTLGSDASGDVYYRNSSGILTRVAAGAQNTVFTMGASSVPSWQAASGGVTSIATTSPISGGTITSTGTISLLVNTDFLFTAAQSIALDDSATNAVTSILDLRHSSSSTPAANFGGRLRFGLETTTTVNQDAAAIDAIWTTATHASRTSALLFSTVNNAGAITEAGRFTGAGNLQLGTGGQFTLGTDTGFARTQAGGAKVSDGGSGYGFLNASFIWAGGTSVTTALGRGTAIAGGSFVGLEFTSNSELIWSGTTSTEGSGDVGLKRSALGVLGVIGASSAGSTFSHVARTATQLSGNVNDYDSGGLSYFQRWSSDASRNVTGFKPGNQTQVDGQVHVIINVGSQNIVLVNESASSTAANRFTCSTGADITLSANQAADVVYSTTTSRWLVWKRN
jgi:hypothetical protein